MSYKSTKAYLSNLFLTLALSLTILTNRRITAQLQQRIIAR